MRRVVTGEGPDGRSTVVSDGPPAPVFRFGSADSGRDPHAFTGAAPTGDGSAAGDGEVVVATLWATDGDCGDRYDVEVPPGATRWRLVEFGPNLRRPLHRTGTLDCDVVLSGTIELLLEDGSVELGAGDVVVIPGVVHAWRTGPEGCVVAVAMTGLTDGGT